MARIYFNCPCSTTKGSNMYTIFRWVFFGAVFVIGLIVILPIPNLFSLSKSDETTPVSELHYGIVIDCGSSGSRIFVYYWPTHSGNPKDLLNIQQLLDDSGNAVVKKVSPGLSSFENDPDSASDHIKELLLYAKQYIPEKKHSETFLYVMATAGMRMLSQNAQQAILQDLQRDITKEFNFIATDNHFEVISGKQEGVYAWIAINYVLDRFSHSPHGPELATVNIQSGEKSAPRSHTRKSTVGIIDMGGGSVQIAFEVTDPEKVKEIPPSLLSELDLGCEESDLDHTYNVYVTTFLGYGANSARVRYEQMLLEQAAIHQPNSGKLGPVNDVCLPKGMKYHSKNEGGRSYQFIGTGDYEACNAALVPLMNLTVPCTKEPCSLNGVHQPHIDTSKSFYGFSEFWYCTEDVLRIGGQYDYTKFHQDAKEFCSTDWNILHDRYKKKLYPKADDDRFRFQCFKSAWMEQVFHAGFSFPHGYSKLTTAQLVSGKDVGWTLGALIYKTKFLPLRAIEKQKELQLKEVTSQWQKASRTLDTSFILIGCFVVVLAAIFIYMKQLKCCPRTSDLSRVPSMSYFMTDQDQMEQGVQLVKGQGYIL
ncbi:ectonucleoside triphosphate diphosphohydrolase 4-like isoform X2 [Physella acuta]|uniref:ectonucleoside triphosphate diphosphohydrolase 4-like isoform X2 n=1 Tax=Physella acuta TaxID=109671 RepID=UPI0027DDC492|nr:ectonucleoside triphosphate diphosphohydrolase 4-like isoform X2 [Physella acuta]